MTHFESVSSWCISSQSFTSSFLFTLGDLERVETVEEKRVSKPHCSCVHASWWGSLLTDLFNNLRQVILQLWLLLWRNENTVIVIGASPPAPRPLH